MASRNSKQIAFEIETGNSDVAANVKKTLAVGIKRIFVIVTSMKYKRRIEQKLADYPDVEVLLADKAMTRENW